MASVGILSVIQARAVDTILSRRTQTISTEGLPLNTVASSTIKAHMQPMTPKEMANATRGQSESEAQNIWSEEVLKNTDQITNPEGDKFTLQGVEFWREGRFYHATAVRESAPG